jgi:hypothetical protein
MARPQGANGDVLQIWIRNNISCQGQPTWGDPRDLWLGGRLMAAHIKTYHATKLHTVGGLL